MKADKLFLNANILFSVAYGSPGLERLWKLAQEGRCELVASQYVIEEAKRNLDQLEHLDKLNGYLSKVSIVAEADPSIPCPIDLPDKDSPVLMAAITAKVDYLLTGDVTHFGKYFGKTIMGVRISWARDYLLSKMKLSA
jgi:predicted nucleic acid-binding protein